jgi:hypothetical protein
MEDRIAVWLIRHRRLVKEDERKAQTSETVIALAIMRLLLRRLAYFPAWSGKASMIASPSASALQVMSGRTIPL